MRIKVLFCALMSLTISPRNVPSTNTIWLPGKTKYDILYSLSFIILWPNEIKSTSNVSCSLNFKDQFHGMKCADKVCSQTENASGI